MANTAKRLSELHTTNLEAAVKLARLSVENSQRVMALQTQLAKSMFDATVAAAKAHTGVHSPQEMVQLHTQYIQDTAKRIMDMARQVGEIANESRSEFSRVLTEQLASGKQELADAVQSMMKNMPAGVPDVKKSVDQAMAKANEAFETLSKLSASALSSIGAKGAAPAKAAAKAKPAAKPAAKKTPKAAAKPAPKAAAKPAAKAKAVAKPAAKAAAKPAAAKPVLKVVASKPKAAAKPKS